MHKSNFTKAMTIFLMAFFIVSPPTFAQEKKTTKEKEEIQEESNDQSTARKIQRHGLGLAVGQTFLLGSFEDKGDDKITFDILYTYLASYSFDLLVNFHSSEHEYKEKKVWLKGLAISIKGRPYEYDSFSPYLLGGLGFYRPQIEKNGEKSEVKNTFGINGGAGVDLRLSHKVSIGVLAQLHMPFDVKQDDMETVRGQYFKLLLTGMYLF